MHLKAEHEYRFGLWQMGKRIKWFTHEQCEKIRKGSDLYLAEFSLEAEDMSRGFTRKFTN
jgi:hypothetical protein